MYIYYGGSTGLSAAAPSTRTGDNTSNYFGRSVAGAGDVNSDGYADVLVGAYHDASQTGKAFVYYGSSTGLSTQAPDTRTGEAPGSSFGISVAGAGDVNGDGYADVLVGAYGNPARPGKAYVYLGNGGSGRTRALRLLNTDLRTRLDASNLSATHFGLGLITHPVFGRTRARLVWETVANGVRFTQNPLPSTATAFTARGPWTDLPATTPTELTALTAKVGRTTRLRARLEYATGSPLNTANVTAPNGMGGVGSQARYGPWTYVTAQQLAGLYAALLPVEQPRATTSLVAYPVPAHDVLHVRGAGPGAVLILHDALGRRVLTRQAGPDGAATLVLPTTLSPGVYLLRPVVQAQ